MWLRTKSTRACCCQLQLLKIQSEWRPAQIRIDVPLPVLSTTNKETQRHLRHYEKLPFTACGPPLWATDIETVRCNKTRSVNRLADWLVP